MNDRRQAGLSIALRIGRLLTFAGALLGSVLVLDVLGQQVSRPPFNNAGNAAKDIATQMDELQHAVAALQSQVTAVQGTLTTFNQRLQSLTSNAASISTLVSNQAAGINQNIAQSQSQIQAQMLDVQRRVATTCGILVEVNAPQHVRVCPQ
jgi:methyl-accepting chemotaxis protein